MDSKYINSSAYAELFIRALQLPAEKVLAGTGLSESGLAQQDYLTADSLCLMFRNIERLGPPVAWAARAGSQLNIGTHGPLGFAALSAPTLGDAVEVMVNHHAARVTSIAAEVKKIGRQYRFVMRDLTGDELYARVLAEVILKIIESLVETIMGHSVGSHVEIHFSHARPKYYKVLEQVYGAPCFYSSSYTGIKFPSSWQHIRSPLYDESMYLANIAKCREIIALQANDQLISQKVESLLQAHFYSVSTGQSKNFTPPSLKRVCEQLYITERTLIRRLKQEDTSYKILLQAARFSSAKLLLQRVSLSVADVAEQLGYKDPANFGRAFKQWAEVTPAEWRRRL